MLVPARRARWRRLFAVAISASLLAAACGGDDGGSSSEEPGDTTSPQAPADPVRGGTLTYAVEADTSQPVAARRRCSAPPPATRRSAAPIFEPLAVARRRRRGVPVPARVDHAERRLHGVDPRASARASCSTTAPPLNADAVAVQPRAQPHSAPCSSPPSSRSRRSPPTAPHRHGHAERAVAGLPDLPQQPVRLHGLADVDRRPSEAGTADGHRAGRHRPVRSSSPTSPARTASSPPPASRTTGGATAPTPSPARASPTSTASRCGSCPTARPGPRPCRPATST